MLSKPMRRILAAGALAGALSLLGALPAAALPGGRDGRTPAVERDRGTLSRLWTQLAKKLGSIWDNTSGGVFPGR
jgi:hypothetical protein